MQYTHFRQCLSGWVLAIVLAAGLTLSACQVTPPTDSSRRTIENKLETVTVNPEQVVVGQTVYVPVYSYIYQFNNRSPVINLSSTLSIRNTDLEDSLILTAVRYYNNNGELVRSYLENPVALPPLASADYFIATDDSSGGFGANFIVEWVAKTSVTEPVIEALMINTAGNQGISFVSAGRVIQRQGERITVP
ncbi:MAG: DUF3124 domain-containing protein [Synechococcales cyanobacterium M58_A2018_015]|nr:DUF3124 domain-containing protein [Synechococcales cyanobacterium M58_A2018_015]